MTEITCLDCSGRGYIFDEMPDIKCAECDGEGTVSSDWLDKFMETYKERIRNKIIQQDTLRLDGIDYFISTVDLCIPANHLPSMPPYETMIFKGARAGDSVYCCRYYNREHAREEHNKLVEKLSYGLIHIDDILD